MATEGLDQCGMHSRCGDVGTVSSDDGTQSRKRSGDARTVPRVGQVCGDEGTGMDFGIIR